MSRSATISRGARGFVLGGAGFLVLCTAAAAAEAPRGTVVALGLHGFVLHTLFGKAYSLVPSYFDRQLAAPRAPLAHLPFALGGALAMALDPLLRGRDAVPVDGVPVDVGTLGAIAWAVGVAIFLATVGWTIRDNLAGGETGTAAAQSARARVDRAANLAMPVALAYLAVGAWETAATAVSPGLSITGSSVAAAHLLAVGTAALLVFAIGARLLPRLFRAAAPLSLVGVVLVPGAVAPALLAGWFAGFGRQLFGALGGPELAGGGDAALLQVAVAALGVAVLGHALLIGLLLYRAPEPRIGAYGVFVGALGGVTAVAVGGAVGLGLAPRLLLVHPRLGLLGFLGVTILGVAFHFYPPTIAGDWGDRVAIATMALLAGGLAAELVGVGADVDPVVDLGQAAAVAGAVTYAGLLARIFRVRAAR